MEVKGKMAGVAQGAEKEPSAPKTSVLGMVAIWMVRQYQRWCRPWMGNHCRFYPSCSDYMILAVQKYGVFRGVPKGIWRICRCQPFCKGGIDEP